MSVNLVYMFALITDLFRSLVQFCLNSSFIRLLLLQVCSDPFYNFVWTARLYVCSYYRSVQIPCTILFEQLVYTSVLITGLFRSLVQFCLNISFRCVYCHRSPVQVPVYWCLNRSFVYLLSSEVCSGPCTLLSEHIIHHIFAVIGGAFRSLWIIVRTDLCIFAVIAGLFGSVCLNILRYLRIFCHQRSVHVPMHHCLTSLGPSFRIIRAAIYSTLRDSLKILL
jgi:hypothetical protein